LVLSGANLSREYFKDRMDRYLHLVDGANGLVDFYAELVEILCHHSNEYQITPPVGATSTSTSTSTSTTVSNKCARQNRNSKDEFLREITQHFQDPNQCSASIASAQDLFAVGDDDEKNRKIVAVGVPTFQAPVGFFRETDGTNGDGDNDDDHDKKLTPASIARDVVASSSTFWSLFRIDQQPPDRVNFVTDLEATLNLLKEAGKSNNSSNGNGNAASSKDRHYTVQLSSAYLNPTTSLLSVLKEGFRNVEFLTAGRISHGFKPKKKDCNEGSQGTDWTIPSVFDKLVDECMSFLRSTTTTSASSGSDTKRTSGIDARLFYWERPDWTFHAKGIWMTEKEENTDFVSNNKTTIEDDDTTKSGEVAAVVIGSSNFGYRSFCRDMESNLVMVFPPTDAADSPKGSGGGDDKTVHIARSFGEEWKNLIASSKREVVETEIDKDHQDQQETTAEKPPPLPWPILKSIPYIKSFF